MNSLHFTNQSALIQLLIKFLLEVTVDGVTTKCESTHLSSVKFVTKIFLLRILFTLALLYLTFFKTIMKTIVGIDIILNVK